MDVEVDSEKFEFIKREKPTFYFIGVTTTKSSIMRLFPLWMKELGRSDIQLIGCDLKLHDEAEAYRRSVAQIKYDPLSLGALVTTHKIDLYEATKDMFDYIDPYAKLCGEISCISKRNGKLEGHAKDPISVGLSMNSVINKKYFIKNGADVLIFGAGGSGVATVIHSASKNNIGGIPSKVILVNRSKPRLDNLRAIVSELNVKTNIDYILNEDPMRNDMIIASLPDYSIVINATGMGKDRPGSPITDNGIFPMYGIAWDFNYRGELNFLRQAERQVLTRKVKIEDGWIYFINGWTQVISQVLHIEINGDLLKRLTVIAENVK
jgi:shikimate 5-dehydrogenase